MNNWLKGGVALITWLTF